jgi:hypothetical protein
MKFYIAGRTKLVSSINQLTTELHRLGHQTVFDWTAEKSYKPYTENKEEAAKFSQKLRGRISSADVFILFWDDSLYGALVELGIFLGSSQGKQPKKIYIVGKNERECVFETMPEFVVLNNTKELLAKIDH